MVKYKYSDIVNSLPFIFSVALQEDVFIEGQNGNNFKLAYHKDKTSPLDVKGIDTNISTSEILSSLRETRERY